MTDWAHLSRDAPDFATAVRARFDAGTNKTIASLRKDGSPRISGTELTFSDGQVSLGMMPRSMKLLDVRRDPRVAVHSPTLEPPPDDPSDWAGDAKLSGRLVGTDPPANNPVAGAAFFVLDISEAVLTYVGRPADHLVIETWDEVHGFRRRTRV
jgi:hypothetical protein